MSGILLVGNDGSNSHPSIGAGACIARTSRFFHALRSRDLPVDVCSVTSRLSSVSAVRDALSRRNYSCVVAISPHPAEIAALAGTELPMWIDMNGMHPAEIHLSGEAQGQPRLEMLRMLALENTLLSRGDAFSAPSGRQVSSIMGELYLLGRLDHASRHLIPAKPIPHCALDVPISTGPSSNNTEFSIISTGSFNSWFDEKTLFDALEYAMKRDPNITFTATGGAVEFAADKYSSFMKRVAGSEFKERFRMVGWVSPDELNRIQLQASAATYTDLPCGETLLGARTRALDWISRGIPVVCTRGAEISEDIGAGGLGILVPSGDAKALGNAYLALASEPEISEKIRAAQKKWREGPGRMETVFEPLFHWCSSPERLKGKQLCQPTVPRVSSSGYRMMVFRHIASMKGPGAAARFLWTSLTAKITKKGH